MAPGLLKLPSFPTEQGAKILRDAENKKCAYFLQVYRVKIRTAAKEKEEKGYMPKNKRESLIYTVMMCFTMVLWMSIYNVTLHAGGFGLSVLRDAWLGFPIAYVFAMCCDWFLVSKAAKGFAFRFLVVPGSAGPRKTVIAVSCCMVVPMVIIMSLYGAAEVCIRSGQWGALLGIWLQNIPKNFIMALPFQLIAAGPLVGYLFRSAFPEGSIVMG